MKNSWSNGLLHIVVAMFSIIKIKIKRDIIMNRNKKEQYIIVEMRKITEPLAYQ